MAQINKGDTFVDGQSVNGGRLNALVDSATLAVGAITDQTNITANTVASGDSILLYDLSATALREANVSDVLNSNLPITTSAITGGAGVNVVITPAATYKVDVAGAFEADSINSTGATTVGGTLGVTGALTASSTLGVTGALTASSTLAVTGTTTLTGAATVGTVTASGTVNITGAIQYNGTPVYGMYEVVKYVANPSPALTKGADEIWVVNMWASQGYPFSITTPQLVITSTSTINGVAEEVSEGFGQTYDGTDSTSYRLQMSSNIIIPVGTTFSAKTLAGNWQVILITKYKTA